MGPVRPIREPALRFVHGLLCHRAARPDRVAESRMLKEKKFVNRRDILGHVPGIKVNERFQLRSEAMALGIHR